MTAFLTLLAGLIVGYLVRWWASPDRSEEAAYYAGLAGELAAHNTIQAQRIAELESSVEDGEKWKLR